jgi:hypothetical protein
MDIKIRLQEKNFYSRDCMGALCHENEILRFAQNDSGIEPGLFTGRRGGVYPRPKNRRFAGTIPGGDNPRPYGA